jgi:hypothetical protein
MLQVLIGSEYTTLREVERGNHPREGIAETDGDRQKERDGDMSRSPG